MEFIPAKTILTKTKKGNDWYGVDFNMNLYRGCSHGCIYCDSRSDCYHINNFDTVTCKENSLFILEKELSKQSKTGIVGIGAMSDTYNPQEIKYEQTRGALKLLAKYGFGVSIDTKSDLILRDIDILKEINNKNNCIIKFTITTPNDDLSRIIEPHVCVSSRRLKAIKELNENGIYAGIMLNPTLPFITDSESDIKKLVKLAYEYKAKFIHTYLGVTLRENQRDYYYEKLDEYFPGLKEKYIKTYGDKYICNPVNSKRLYQVFTEECQKYGILYKMEDIIADYKKNSKNNEQISLFD
ncbi:MAG: radical SAM protein [Bacilli bacterium]|nr:radical SAM protein [Bacilli bacterium]